jgi:hypothetical protein
MSDEQKPKNKPVNINLLRMMIKLSNNSRLTQDAAGILTNSLDATQMNAILGWFQHASNQSEFKEYRARSIGKRP